MKHLGWSLQEGQGQQQPCRKRTHAVSVLHWNGWTSWSTAWRGVSSCGDIIGAGGAQARSIWPMQQSRSAHGECILHTLQWHIHLFFLHPSGNTSCTPLSATPKSHRHQRDDDLLQFVRDSEAASQRWHEGTLAQLRSAQQGFESLMSRLLDKLWAQMYFFNACYYCFGVYWFKNFCAIESDFFGT